jgi:hypothetical protein
MFLDDFFNGSRCRRLLFLADINDIGDKLAIGTVDNATKLFMAVFDAGRVSLEARFDWKQPKLKPRLHRKKKVREFPVPSRDVTTKLSLGGNNDVITELFLPWGSLVTDIPAGDGKLGNLFLRCIGTIRNKTFVSVVSLIYRNRKVRAVSVCFGLFRNSLFWFFRFYTQTESFDVSIEPKQTEEQRKQFDREHILVFKENLGLFFSVCFSLFRNSSVCFGSFDIGYCL